jgi:hypothetical protein
VFPGGSASSATPRADPQTTTSHVMVRLALMVVAVCAGMLVAGCGRDGPGRCFTAPSGHEFCDELAGDGYDTLTAYEISRRDCRGSTMKQVAREYGTAADAASAAEGYATSFEGRASEAAFEGCLDGFEDRIPPR